MGAHDRADGDLRAQEPPCVLCAIGDSAHRHDEGRVPSTGCLPCFEGRHSECDPETYWCTCTHPVCRPAMRGTE